MAVRSRYVWQCCWVKWERFSNQVVGNSFLLNVMEADWTLGRHSAVAVKSGMHGAADRQASGLQAAAPAAHPCLPAAGGAESAQHGAGPGDGAAGVRARGALAAGRARARARACAAGAAAGRRARRARWRARRQPRARADQRPRGAREAPALPANLWWRLLAGWRRCARHPVSRQGGAGCGPRRAAARGDALPQVAAAPPTPDPDSRMWRWPRGHDGMGVARDPCATLFKEKRHQG